MTPRSSAAVWFLAPWAVGLVLLTLLPALAALGLSFTRFGDDLSLASPEVVGLSHYRNALGVDAAHTPTDSDPWYWRALRGRPNDPRLYKSLANSLFFTLIAVPLGLCSSLAVALLLNQRLRGMTIFRALMYVPHLLGGVATVMIWSWLLNPQFGWTNELIRWAYACVDPIVRIFHDGGTSTWGVPTWLYSPRGCKPALILMHVWTMGGSMLIFLAALRRVRPELYSAARIDGASRLQRFRNVTLPQISPAILFCLVMGLIFAMQSFHNAYLLQNRAQSDGLLFYVLYLYETAFEPPYRLGYAAALAWILFAVLAAMVLPLLIAARRWVHYESEPRGA